MEEWKEYNISDAPLVPLTDLVEFIVDNRGKTVPTAAKGIKLIATNCIRNEYLYPLYEKVRYVSEDIYNTWFRSHPKPGDIIFVNKGTPGKCALVPDPLDFCIAQDMMAFRLKTDLVYNKYLLAILRSRELQNFIVNNQVGTIIPHFKKEQLKTLMIPMPEMLIQRKIGDLYFNFSEKAEINRRINENLEQQAQALFKSWFVDFEPFKNGEFVESELGMIPKGWRVERIEDLSQKMASGGTPKSLNKDYYLGNIKWYSTKELKDCFLFDSEKHISEDALKNSSAKMFPEGTVLMAIYASPTVGRLGILTNPATFNQAAVGIVPKENVGSEFIYLSLLSERTNLNILASGAAQQNLNVGIVKNYNILVPEQKALDRFNRLARSYFLLLKKNTEESRRLAELRDTLLPKLMSGELKVNEIA